MEWYKVQSLERPEETDTTSSKVYNFVRRNIVETEMEQENEARVILYEYEECRIPKEAWGLYLAQQQQNDDIDSCMVALTEIYEAMEV